MAYSNEGLKWNSIAEAAVAKNVFVMVGVADNTVLTATAGAKIIGVAENSAAISTAIGVTHQGQVKLLLGAPVTIGERIKATTAGVGTPVASDFDEYGAVALEDGVSGDVISVLIEKGVYGV